MTFDEIKQIPDLQIELTPLIEDCFYFQMALAGKISDEKGQEAMDRMDLRRNDPDYKKSFETARKMMANLKKYGVACAAWV